MKKLLSVVLILAMVFTLLSVPAVGLLSDPVRMLGAGDYVTRAEAITALYSAGGSPAVQFDDYYTDVPADQSFTDAVMWAHHKRFILGYENGKFFPDQEITREELATMLYGAFTVEIKRAMAAEDISHYSDYGSVSAWAEHSLAWCIFRGVFAANGGRLDPQEPVSGGELATMLAKLEALKNDPRDIWVLNPVPTRSPIEVPGLAPRVTGGWENKTVVILANYNGNTTAIGTELTSRMPESTNLIWVGDMTVIAGQTVNPSRAPTVGNWTTLTYAQFQSQLSAGTLVPDAVITGVGF